MPAPTDSSRSRSTPMSSNLSSKSSLLQATDRSGRASRGLVHGLGARVSRGTVSLPLLSRVVIGSAGSSILIAGAFAVLLIAMSDLRSSTNAQAHSKDVSTATLEVERVVNQLEAGLRGYVNGGGASFLASWQQARRNLPQALADLNRVVATQPTETRQAHELAFQTHDYITEYGVQLIKIYHVNQKVARLPVATRTGLARISDIRDLLSGLLAGEDRLASARQASAKREAARAVSVGIAA